MNEENTTPSTFDTKTLVKHILASRTYHLHGQGGNALTRGEETPGGVGSCNHMYKLRLHLTDSESFPGLRC